MPKRDYRGPRPTKILNFSTVVFSSPSLKHFTWSPDRKDVILFPEDVEQELRICCSPGRGMAFRASAVALFRASAGAAAPRPVPPDAPTQIILRKLATSGCSPSHAPSGSRLRECVERERVSALPVRKRPPACRRRRSACSRSGRLMHKYASIALSACVGRMRAWHAHV